MRELNECKAEVFRRSEKRIKERKKKLKRILALCIPLCLAVTVLSFAVLTKEKVKYGDYGAESYVCSYTEAVISTADGTYTVSRKITDKVEVTNIFSAIFNLYNEAYDAGTDGNENAGALPDTSTESNNCVITFRTEDGFQTVYTLEGNELSSVDENMKTVLTDSQVAELKEVLGI